MTTPNMAITEPTDHGSADVWGAALNAAIDLIDAHDHTAGKGTKVPSAALKINADVSWSFGGTNYAITDAKGIDFTPVTAASMASYSSALFANSSDSNNLYYRNSAGTNVQITSGGTLNIAVSGGIGGDYASISALVDYDDASDTYRFRQQTSASVRQFAKMSSADVNLYEYIAAGGAVVPATAVTLKSPASLGASYSVTWPAAVPASTVLLQSTSAGVLTFTNSLASNANLTLSGTGRIPHGNYTRTYAFVYPNVVTGGTVSGSTGNPGVTVAASTAAWFPIPNNEHFDRVQSIQVFSVASANSTDYAIVRNTDPNTATFTADFPGTFTTTSVSGPTLTPTTPALIGDGMNLWLRVTTGGGSTRTFITMTITYDAT